jgi:DNA-binding transcriptional LysR family regulator
MLGELAARGLGVAVLTTTAATGQKDDLHILQLVRPQLRARLTLAWRSGNPISPAARVLISHARDRLISSDEPARS